MPQNKSSHRRAGGAVGAWMCLLTDGVTVVWGIGGEGREAVAQLRL